MRLFLFSAAIEVMARIEPPPALPISGAASCDRRNSEKTFS